ncbi:MAG: hypothetical protein KGM42_13790 [Hyphomicrobiales bacterium]|nr:hypothetical protein [Hyphomicrobiales bacterium]
MSEDLSMKAAEYVLGTLDAVERAAFARALASDPVLQAQVRAWENRLAPMAGVAPAVEPPAALWDRIDSEIESIATGANVVVLRRSVTRWRTAAAVVGSLAACLAIVAVLRGPGAGVEPSAPQQRVAQAAPAQTQQSTGGAAQSPAQQSPPVPASSTPVNRTAPVVAAGTGQSVETASAARPQGPGSVSLAAGARDSGAISVEPGAARAVPEQRSPDLGRPDLVAALTPGGGQGDLIVRVDRKTGTLNAYRSGPDALDGKPVELWLIAQGRPAQAIGLLTGSSRSFQLPAGLSVEGAEIAATVESGEIAPDAQPSGPFVLRGRLSKE